MALRGVLALLLLGGITAPAQRLLSARAGVVNWLRGSVFIDDTRVALRPSRLLLLKDGQTLRSPRGRAELLLGERVYLRMIEGASVRMEDNHMDDTRLLLQSGSVLIEVVQIHKGANLRLLCGDSATALRVPGLYRFEAEPCNLRVYRGEVLLENGAKAKAGQAANLTGELAIAKFDPKETDPLYAWAEQRTQQRITRERRQEEIRAMIRARRRLQEENP